MRKNKIEETEADRIISAIQTATEEIVLAINALAGRISATENHRRGGVATIQDAAKFLGVSARTVGRLMDDGKIGFTRGGQVRKLPWLELVRYLESGFIPARDG